MNYFDDAKLYAKSIRSQSYTISHVAKILVQDDTFRKVFNNTFSASDYGNLLEDIEETCNSVTKYPPYMRDFAIRDTFDFRKLREIAVDNSRIGICETGDIEAPHLFNAICDSQFDQAGIYPFFLRKSREEGRSLADMIDDFYTELVDEVSTAKGIAAAPENPFNMGAGPAPAPGFGGLFGRLFGGGEQQQQQQKDWHEFCEDLIEKAKDYNKPFIGREDVIDRTIQVLCRMEKSNPMHVGEPGVGKTAITLGLAKKLAENDVPEQLKDHKLYSVDLSAMVAGTKFRGEFEERMVNLLKGAKEEGNVILFFDEIHTIVGAGDLSGSMDASNIMKPYLTDGSIKFIGATTYKEFQRIEKDGALMRRFNKIEIKEPSVEDAIKICMGLREAYEAYHCVSYTDEAIETAVKATAKYVHDRFLPDKAIDIIDEAGAAVSIKDGKDAEVSKDNVEDVISTLCKIPKKSFSQDEFRTIRNLSKNLSNKIFGQPEAIKEAVESIKLSKSGLGDEDKPIASFLFVGPTGCGKTELAKQLAKELEIDFVRFDMSEYKEENSVSKLIGTSAGYVGYEDGGLLVKAIRKTPHCVLLLDEIEKAHPAVFEEFLQVMDHATLTDGQGHIADFRNVVIIMTSNVGAKAASMTKAVGFNANAAEASASAMTTELNRTFTPEFRNRLTKIIMFNQIDEEVGKLIVKKELKLFNDKLAIRGVSTTFSDACVAELVRLGISPEFGAREIQRLISSKIKSQFVDLIVNGEKAKKYVVDFKDGEFKVKAAKVAVTH